MADEAPAPSWPIRRRSSPATLAVLVAVAAVSGALTGLVGGAFRWLLRESSKGRLDAVDAVRGWPGPSWLVPVAAVAACAAVARLIVRFVPLATGSGIQDVEADWRGDAPPAPPILVPAKFVGGLLAIGSGLALGREGPTVHMGAVMGSATGRRSGLPPEEVRLLQAALGGAGLAVAFNAPVGGALFVFEEVTHSLRWRLVLVTAVSCAAAVATSHVIVSNAPIFAVAEPSVDLGWSLLAMVVFGALTGVLATLYNRTVMGTLHLSDRVAAIGLETQAALIGGVVGLCLFLNPYLVGGGDRITERVLAGGVGLAALAGFVVARLGISPVSYASGAPGGLFAPLLAIGATWGALFHALLHGVAPGIGAHPEAYAIVGMAAVFAAVVRAPFTGIALIVEMTLARSLLVPMLIACLVAVGSAHLLRSVPIYDSLRARMFAEPGATRSGPESESPA